MLINDSTHPPVSFYESHFIPEWARDQISARRLRALLPPENVVYKLFAKQVRVLCDGMCDALVLLFCEKQREGGKRSKKWMERQMRNVNGL